MRLAHLRCVLFGHCWSYETYFGKLITPFRYPCDRHKIRTCQRCGAEEVILL